VCVDWFFVQHVVQLHEELNQAAAEGNLTSAKTSNWTNTSLKPHIEYFKDFVTKLSNAARQENPRSYAKQAASNAQSELASTDW